MKKKDISVKKTAAPAYVATKHWASEFKFKLSVFPPVLTAAFTIVAACLGWFEEIANAINSIVSSILGEVFTDVTATGVMIFVIVVGFAASVCGWVIQIVRIRRIKPFHVDFYEDGIIELHDGKSVTRRTFFGFYKAEVFLPTPSIILPEVGARFIKKLVCWKPLAYNYGDVVIECLEAPNDVIKLYSIKAPKELVKYLESTNAKTEYTADAESIVEYVK